MAAVAGAVGLSALSIGAPVAGAAAASAGEKARDYSAGPVRARVRAGTIELRNDEVRRIWSRAPFRTESFVDRRAGGARLGSPVLDFSLDTTLGRVRSTDFRAATVTTSRLPRGGLSLRIELVPSADAAPGSALLRVTRTVEAFPHVAGLRTQTTIHARAPVALSGAVSERVAVGRARPTIHAFRAGSDWREPGYDGPPVVLGDPHAGTWRATRRAPVGSPLAGPAQWITAARGGRTVFMVSERNDFPSSRAAYDGSTESLVVDYSRDVLTLGPFEENAHVENGFPGLGRRRVIEPGASLALEPAFVGFGSSSADAAWQFHRYLVEHRLAPYPHAVTFNTNGVDQNTISTGAKDDADLRTIRRLAPVARRLGVETFVLDDGWQARSGDWFPDSPQHPEPRYDGSPGSKFAPRFPDDRFRAVRKAIAPMRLGLWMSPLNYNPSAESPRRRADWPCQPLASALEGYSGTDPGGGSNEAGIVPWSARAIPHVEARIRDAIQHWGVRYWKFDFMAWLDCAGANDMYELHDAFLAMIDRLRARFPRVTFQIDETNDYRLFPFESVSRGPTWFQNGSPPVSVLLHNLWNLSPYVPAFALGQHVLAGEEYRTQPVSTLMAAALLSHITFFSDIRELPAPVVDEAGRWLRFYQRHRDLFSGVVYPLLRDPLANSWTALQAWDPARRRGALLAFRQDDHAPTKRIALRDVPAGRYELRTAPGGERAATVGADQLRKGLRLELPPRGATVLLIRPTGSGA